MKTMWILFALVSFAVADWSSPQTLKHIGKHVKHFDVYLSQKQQLYYVAYCAETTSDKGDTTQDLRLFQMRADFSITHSYVISTEFGCRNVKVTGDDEGRNLVVVFEGQRKHQLDICSEDNPSACYEIYITESNYFATKWTKPFPVPRDSIKDPVDRMSPSIIYNKDSGRVFVIYNYKGEESRIAFVTRPPNSLIFSPEKIIEEVTLEANSKMLGSLATYRKSNMILHIFIEKFGVPEHIYTKNFLTWTEEALPAPGTSFTNFFAEPRIQNETIVGVYHDGKSTGLLVSLNSGETWKKKGNVLDKYHRVSAGTFCASGESVKFHFLTTSFMQTNQTYTSFDLTGDLVLKGPTPYQNMENFGVFLPHMNCYNDRKTKTPVLSLVSYIWMTSNEPKIYATNNIIGQLSNSLHLLD